jgi:hypothetical protein
LIRRFYFRRFPCLKWIVDEHRRDEIGIRKHFVTHEPLNSWHFFGEFVQQQEYRRQTGKLLIAIDFYGDFCVVVSLLKSTGQLSSIFTPF